MKRKIQEAYNEGRGAGLIKKGRHTCPYGGGPRRVAWLGGYSAGFEELKLRQEQEDDERDSEQ